MQIPPKNPSAPPPEEDEIEHRHWSDGLMFPLLFVVLIWIVFLLGEQWGESFREFGVYPRKVEGLIGILTHPLVHGGWNHLIDNSVPLLVLGWALFYFYRPIAFPVFFWIYLMTGVWVWVSARASWHIGASGVVYGLVAFLFFSGVLRKHVKLMSISMLVVFLYGSLFWGILPIVPSVSWEGHFWGAVAGIVLAFYYRKEGPQRPLYEWEKEELMEQEGTKEEPGDGDEERPKRRIRYVFRPRRGKRDDREGGNGQ